MTSVLNNPVTRINKDELVNEEIIEIINYINNFRKEFDVPLINYNNDLTLLAKHDAINYLKIKCNKVISNANNNLENNNSDNKYSKNILFLKHARNLKMLNIKNIINKWYNEQKYYDFDNENNTKFNACQNFINLIFESNLKCGFWYSYINGKCVLCMYFSE